MQGGQSEACPPCPPNENVAEKKVDTLRFVHPTPEAKIKFFHSGASDIFQQNDILLSYFMFSL